MIIDFHTHLFPDKVAERTVEALKAKSGNTPYSNGTTEGLLSALRRAGVSLAINHPVLTRAEQFDSVFRFCSEINQKYSPGLPISKDSLASEPKILSFMGIHPDIDKIEERLMMVRNAGFLGIKIHPDYQGTFFDDPRYVKILGEAKSLGLITITHAGVDGAFIGEPVKCTPDRVLRVLDKIGGYPSLVLAHLGANMMADEFFGTLAGEDVYIDTANLISKTDRDLLMRYIEEHGEDKILFATDSPWSDVKADAERLRSFGLPREVENKITHENALRLLNARA